VSTPADVSEAYAHCEAVTREQAANFFYGIRLLPRDRRQGMCAVYAFARRVDDIGDGSLDRDEKLRRLDAEALALAALEQAATPPPGGDPVMVALEHAHRRFAFPSGALGELIEGVRMDVNEITYERFEDLVLYCRRVAGAIGRLCLAIFVLAEPASTDRSRAEELADDLGVALQLTNILRDLREDAENGRVYLPDEDLRRFGVLDDAVQRGAPSVLAELAAALPGSAPGAAPEVERLYALVRFEAERAGEWFDRGLELASLLDRRSAACVLAMAGIYRRLLDRIESHPERAVRQRMSLPAREKALVAARSLLGGRV